MSIEERYANREALLGLIAIAAIAVVDDRFLQPEDVPDVSRRRRRITGSRRGERVLDLVLASGGCGTPTSCD